MGTDATKRCPRCGETKPLPQFSRDRRRPLGYGSYCKSCNYAKNKTLLRSDYYRRYRKAWELKHRYALTLEEFYDMVRQQGGCCAICQRAMKPLVVDHDHTTGKVRALLCASCNRLLGFANDDPGVLRAALDYLASHHETQ